MLARAIAGQARQPVAHNKSNADLFIDRAFSLSGKLPRRNAVSSVLHLFHPPCLQALKLRLRGDGQQAESSIPMLVQKVGLDQHVVDI